MLVALFLSAGAALSLEEEEAEAVVTKKLPIGAELYFSNNVGASTFSKAYQQDPYVTSNLYAYPFFKVGPFLGERELKIHAEASSQLEWLGEKNPFPGVFRDKFNFGDVKLRAELKKAFYNNNLGFSFAPTFEIEVPFSKTARVANRILGIGGYFTAVWEKWGVFLKYKPVATAYTHSAPYKSDQCPIDAENSDRIGAQECRVEGRQTMVMWKNTLSTGYTHGNHTITLALRTYHAFLRDAGKGEKPEKTPSSGIMEATLGFLEYEYVLPASIPTTLTFGLSGYQSPYDARGKFRVPFFSFTEPAKNLTEAYVAINVTI